MKSWKDLLSLMYGLRQLGGATLRKPWLDSNACGKTRLKMGSSSLKIRHKSSYI